VGEGVTRRDLSEGYSTAKGREKGERQCAGQKKNKQRRQAVQEGRGGKENDRKVFEKSREEL